MTTIQFRLISIDETFTNPGTVLAELSKKKGVYLAGINFIDSIPREIVKKMSSLPTIQKVIILNGKVDLEKPTLTIQKERQFPFCSVHKSAAGSSVMSADEALKDGNVLLCLVVKKQVADEESDRPEGHELTNGQVHEYISHIPLEKVGRWTKDPYDINLGHSSDHSGGHSRRGDTVSWLNRKVRDRMQYGMEAGLFPKE